MKSLQIMIADNVKNGMTDFQAKNYTCQEIILNKISKSPLANNILLKGGVVMFNMTHNLRRVTSDLDIDFIRYSISEESIKKFVNLLNKYDSEYKVALEKIEPLHQEDYKGKRIKIKISDGSTYIKYKMDIGVHTLLTVKQKTICFYFDPENPIELKVNPPEQIFAEKLYSLAKHGALTTRYKDVFDIYYFINQNLINKKTLKICMELLISGKSKIRSIDELCDIVENTFKDEQFAQNIKTTKDKWIDVDYQIIFGTILDFIYSI